MALFYVPTSGPEDWRPMLAKPDTQWRTGYSAKTLAHCWESAQGFPRAVASLFEDSAPDTFRGIELLVALPEHKVPLPGGGASSQCDLWCLAKANGRLVSIAVEGKVSESFGPTMAEWSEKMSSGKRKRLGAIQDELGIVQDIPGHIRYQLLHRTAAAIAEARRFNAPRAVMIVHSFSREKAGWDDFAAFLELMDAPASTGLVPLGTPRGIEVFTAWAEGGL